MDARTSGIRRVVFVAFEGIQSLDLTGPWEVLDTADRLLGPDSGYELVLASCSGAPIRSSSGLALGVERELASVVGLDTLLVPGGHGTRGAMADQGTITGIRRLAGLARRTAGVCTGAMLLAEAGLLEGRRAVTHWAYCDQFAERYPGVTVEPDAIFVRDGQIITSAGVTAGIDLALALVEEDHGRELALEVARWLVVFAQRPGGQSQFSVQLSHPAAATPSLQDLQSWIAEHLADDLCVGELAARVHLSERQLSRRFRGELGASPADYVEQARVERARALLERSDDGLEQVAGACGFASAEVLRRAFQRRLGTPPRSYRDRFRSPTHV